MDGWVDGWRVGTFAGTASESSIGFIVAHTGVATCHTRCLTLAHSTSQAQSTIRGEDGTGYGGRMARGTGAKRLSRQEERGIEGKSESTVSLRIGQFRALSVAGSGLAKGCWRGG